MLRAEFRRVMLAAILRELGWYVCGAIVAAGAFFLTVNIIWLWGQM